MDIVRIVGVAAAIALFGWALYRAVIAINGHSALHYDGYQPISFARTGVMILPSALPLLAHVIEGRDNMMAACAIGGIVTLLVAIHIAYHTSIPIAIGAVPVLLVIGALATAVVFWFLFLRTGRKKTATPSAQRG